MGQIKYDKSVFQRHLKDYRKNIGMEKNNPKIEFFLKKLDTLIVSLRDNPGHTNENIYTFLRDKELRRFLETEDIEARLIPLEEEWNKDSFRSSVFHYVNKIEILRKKIEDAQEINSLQIPEKTK